MAKTWPHNGEQLTVKQIRVLKQFQVTERTIRERLKLGRSVQQVLDEPILSKSQIASKGAKKSCWGAQRYGGMNGGVNR